MKRIILVFLISMALASGVIAEGWSWTSSDEAVIRVWPDGSVVVAGIGTATLTGTAQDGETVTINMTVPEDFAAADSNAPYIGNRNTRKFHSYDCASVNDMKESNKEPLSSREDAVGQGYVPCGRCKP